MRKLLNSALAAAMLSACAGPEVYLGGARATGRVAQVYVRVAGDVFLAADRVPEHLRKNAERWVEVQFRESLADRIGSARAVFNQREAELQVGDVVEVKFGYETNPRFFPLKEITRVTKLVARKDEMLAKDYERGILARNRGGT
ncbi:MAG: hypothetical protein HYY28_12605 [Betaproteobacteria bacterium]|nr:hypothetical protein [Betaproteobacteria bacterium]